VGIHGTLKVCRIDPLISLRIRSDPPLWGTITISVWSSDNSRKKAIKPPSGDQAGL